MTLDKDMQDKSIDLANSFNTQYTSMNQAFQCISMYLKAFQAFFGVQLLLDPTTLVTIDLGIQIGLMLAFGN